MAATIDHIVLEGATELTSEETVTHELRMLGEMIATLQEEKCDYGPFLAA